MSYQKTNWQDAPSTETPINATNLNRMESGIESASKNIDNVSAAFVITQAYAEGDYCIYEDDLYLFTASKTAGAWDPTVVEKTSIGKVLSNFPIPDSDLDTMLAASL